MPVRALLIGLEDILRPHGPQGEERETLNLNHKP